MGQASIPTELELQCALLGGVAPAGALWLARSGLAELGIGTTEDLARRGARLKVYHALRARGFLRPGASPVWSPAPQVGALCNALTRAQVGLLWRDAVEYPARFAGQLGAAAPAWLWCAGDPARLARPAVAMVGSRRTSPALLAVAHRLARALAAAGYPVVSGLATGADSAAHAGALSAGTAGAGTIALPARGLLQLDLTPVRRGVMTALGLGPPAGGFHTGLALARNDLIAAQGRVLVLVASELAGGSCYAVDWARRHGTALFCFECGRATPPLNRQLLRNGVAQPLALGADEKHVAGGRSKACGEWVEALGAAVADAERKDNDNALRDAEKLQLSFLPQIAQ
jgi:hypothetical protein